MEKELEKGLEMVKETVVEETDEIMEEVLENFNAAEQALVDEMFKRGEIVMYDFKGEIQKRNRFRNKLLVTAGLGLAVYAGYAIYKTIVKRKGTQSEVIVEEGEK